MVALPGLKAKQACNQTKQTKQTWENLIRGHDVRDPIFDRALQTPANRYFVAVRALFNDGLQIRFISQE